MITITNLNIIAAVALNGIIGNSKTNDIPWKLRADLLNFKAITTGKTIVMGRKTFESIGSKPLSNRRNVVITSDPQFCWRYKVPTYQSLAEMMQMEEADDLYVIGGQGIYAAAMLLYPARLYITVVKLNAEGDIKFPSEGRAFLGNLYMSPQLNLYRRTLESKWEQENGIEFQFTEFTRVS